MTRPLTIVAVHAHPDDETLFTGGTLAGAAAEGHRVVLVTATLGEAGDGGTPRRPELHAAAAALGCARVCELGYHDSGLHGDARPADGTARRLIDVPVDEAAARVADILREENADVVLGYDERGGYGHPDHVRVHLIARRAAEIAGTGLLLEATVDRHRLRFALRLLRLGGRLLPRLPLAGAAAAFTPREHITHVADVRPYARTKRAALHAHTSQTRGGGIRTVALLGRLPLPLFRLAAGHEWYVEPGRRPGPRDDLFATLRQRSDQRADGRGGDDRAEDAEQMGAVGEP